MLIASALLVINLYFSLVVRGPYGFLLVLFNLSLFSSYILLGLELDLFFKYNLDRGGAQNNIMASLFLATLPFVFLVRSSPSVRIAIPDVRINYQFGGGFKAIFFVLFVFLSVYIIYFLISKGEMWLTAKNYTDGGAGGSSIFEYAVIFYAFLALFLSGGKYSDVAIKFLILTVSVLCLLYGERMSFISLLVLLVFILFRNKVFNKLNIYLGLSVLIFSLFFVGVARWGLFSLKNYDYTLLVERALNSTLTGVVVSTQRIEDFVSAQGIFSQLANIFLYMVPLPGFLLDAVAYDPYKSITNNVFIPGGGYFYSYFGSLSYVVVLFFSIALVVMDKNRRVYSLADVLFLVLSFRIIFYSPAPFFRQVVFIGIFIYLLKLLRVVRLCDEKVA